jgi:Family of unknown function (DUF6176)
METRCIKIRLRDDSEPRVLEWAAELNRRREEVLDTLRAEGVVFETAFLDHQADGVYLIYIMRSDNFESAHSIAARSVSPIDQYHLSFKTDCWETRTMLKQLIDFEIELPPKNS